MTKIKNTRLQNARVAAGMTLVSLAEATGNKLSASRIGNYESGMRQMKVPQAKILGEVLNVGAGYLLGIDHPLDGTEVMSEAKQELISVIQGVVKLSDLNARQVTDMLKAYLKNSA